MTVLELASRFHINTGLHVLVVNDSEMGFYANIKSINNPEYIERYGSLTVIDFYFNTRLNIIAKK